VVAPARGAKDLEEVRALAEQRAREIARKAGFVLRSVEATREGNDLIAVEARADFSDLSVFADPALSVGPAPAPAGGGFVWSFVTPREIRYRDGRFSARVLRGSAPPRDDPFRAALAGRHARFTVHLPGEVAHADGARAGSSVTWRFPLGQLCDEPAEMNAEAEVRSLAGPLVLGGLLLAGLGVVVASLFRKGKGVR
jgi:hypothetical protein